MGNPASASRLFSCLAALAVACSASAQHGGGAHAGPAMSPRGGGFAPAGHPGFAGPAASHGQGSAPASRGAYGSSSLFPSPGITSTRPVYYSNGIARYGTPDRRGPRYGYNGGPVGFIGLGYPGYLDSGFDTDFLDPTYNPNTAPVGEGSGLLPDAVINPQPPTVGNYGGYPDPGYGSYTNPNYPQPNYPQPTEQAEAAATEPEPAPAPTPFLARPTRRTPAPAPLPEEDAVTIVFKDGRPPEQIRNYALTRTTLYITAAHVRSIAVDEIDLAATEKINAKAGVDFQLPKN